MCRRILTSSKGLTLVELLAALAVFSIISVIIIGYLLGGMKSFKKVNEDIALHDEANYVMSEFVKYIFVATKVEEVPASECDSCIDVTGFQGATPTRLGFDNGHAIINGEQINSEKFRFSNADLGEESKIYKNEAEDKYTVIVNIFIENNDSSIKLDSEISYVKVD